MYIQLNSLEIIKQASIYKGTLESFRSNIW